MNNWNFTGRLGKDAETRYLPNGDAVTNFSVAVDFGYGEKKGTIWARCSMYGKRAEAVSPYLKKGQQIAISGELSERKWTDKEGVEKTTQEVRVNDLTLVGGKQEGESAEPKQPQNAPAKKSKLDQFDDDIPF
jgi:single-strand DNA-binding protein